VQPVRARVRSAPAGGHAVRTARSWRGIVAFTHPRTGGAHDSHHRTAGIAGLTRRGRGGVAARGARAADGQAADLGFLGPTAHSAANEWVAALAQRLRDVET
jgi:hypothetical protein